MDYLKLVLLGYFDQNNRENLPHYFFREFKKAEKEYFEAAEFFDSCLGVIEAFEKDINYQMAKQKSDLHFVITLLKSKDEPTEDAEKELQSLNLFNYTVYLPSKTNRIFEGVLYYKEVLIIKKAIIQAYQKAIKHDAEVKTNEGKPSPIIETANSNFNELQLSEFLKHPFIFLMRQTLNTLEIKPTEWILGNSCDSLPFGEMQHFADNARDYFEDFEVTYYFLFDKTPAAIQKINEELEWNQKTFEAWKLKNPEAVKKEPFLHLQNIIYRASKLYHNQNPAPPLPEPRTPEVETTASKIAVILKEQLKRAFDEPGHIDNIVEALAEYAKGKTPDCVVNEIFNCKIIQISSKEFYTPFKGLNKKIGLTNKKIAEVLHYFIYANDGSQNAIKKTAIEQNIKRKYPKSI